MGKPAVKTATKGHGRTKTPRAGKSRPARQVEPNSASAESTLESNFASYLKRHLNDQTTPFAKVSITMPEWLREEIAERVGSRQFSSYVTYALIRETQRESLKAFLVESVEAYGPPSKKDRAWAKNQLTHR